MTPAPDPEALTWKPGPPPLDQPGRFDAVFRSRCGGRGLVVVRGDGRACDDNDYDYWGDDITDIAWHFAIPEPPVSAECRAASTGESGP